MGEVWLLLISSIMLIYTIFLCNFLSNKVGVNVKSIPGFNVNLEILRGLACFLFSCTYHYVFWLSCSQIYCFNLHRFFWCKCFLYVDGIFVWGQVINKRIDFNSFYLKRFFRLVPIVITVVAVVTFIDFILNKDRVFNILQIIAIVKNFMFGFGGVNDVFSDKHVFKDKYNLDFKMGVVVLFNFTNTCHFGQKK